MLHRGPNGFEISGGLCFFWFFFWEFIDSSRTRCRPSEGYCQARVPPEMCADAADTDIANVFFFCLFLTLRRRKKKKKEEESRLASS